MLAKTCSVAILFLLAGAVVNAQQILVLTSGIQIQGKYAGGDVTTVDFIDADGHHHTYNTFDIQNLIFNMSGAPASTQSADRGYLDTDVEPAVGWERYKMIPAGAEITVRNVDPIDVRDADPSRHFLASVDREVRDSTGAVAVPKGASAHLIVRRVKSGQIALDLRSVNFNGQRYLLDAQDLTKPGALPFGIVGANTAPELHIPPNTTLHFLLGETVYLYE